MSIISDIVYIVEENIMEVRIQTLEIGNCPKYIKTIKNYQKKNKGDRDCKTDDVEEFSYFMTANL